LSSVCPGPTSIIRGQSCGSGLRRSRGLPRCGVLRELTLRAGSPACQVRWVRRHASSNVIPGPGGRHSHAGPPAAPPSRAGRQNRGRTLPRRSGPSRGTVDRWAHSQISIRSRQRVSRRGQLTRRPFSYVSLSTALLRRTGRRHRR